MVDNILNRLIHQLFFSKINQSAFNSFIDSQINVFCFSQVIEFRAPGFHTRLTPVDGFPTLKLPVGQFYFLGFKVSAPLFFLKCRHFALKTTFT
jgi:hypothetical protein